MKSSARCFLVATVALLSGAPALAQYYPAPQPAPAPPPPPPQYYPPAPPPQYYPAPPPVYYQPPPTEERKVRYTIRASGGVAFASNGYYCGYYYRYYTVTYACGAGYTAAWPNINVDLDVWFRPTLGISLGANVMWGTYTPSITGVPSNKIYSTTWEPHVDVLASLPGNPQVKGRVRFGLGIYIEEANGNNVSGTNVTYNNLGGALRLGVGPPSSPSHQSESVLMPSSRLGG